MDTKQTNHSHVSTRLGVALIIFAIATVGAVTLISTPLVRGDEGPGAKVAQAPDTGGTLDRVAKVLRNGERDAQARVEEALRILSGRHEQTGQASPLTIPEEQQAPSAVPSNTPWDPFTEMQQMQASMDRMFGNSMMHRQTGQGMPMGQASAVWSPRGEFRETPKAYVYRFDVPGVSKGELNVTLQNGQLVLQGKRSSEVKKSGDSKGVFEREVRVGQFERAIALPADADTQGATKTQLKNGVLTIEIPKRAHIAESGPRRLEIQ